MQLTIWQLLGLVFAGCFMTLLGAVIAGILVYKTKYAGKSLIAEKEPEIKAEAFNLDEDFIDDFMAPAEESKAELPPEIEEANQSFLKQFAVSRMIKAGDKQKEAA